MFHVVHDDEYLVHVATNHDLADSDNVRVLRLKHHPDINITIDYRN